MEKPFTNLATWLPLRQALLAAVFATSLWTSALASPEVISADLPHIQTVLRNFHGQVVLVNFWATWCVPCSQEFPDLVTLQDRYGSRGFQVVSICTDEPKHLESLVLPFLDRNNVNFPVFLEKGSNEAFARWFSPRWIGQLPASFVYNRSGTLSHELHGRQTLSGFEAAIVPLL